MSNEVIKNDKDKQTTLFKDLESAPFTRGTVIFNKEKLVSLLRGINEQGLCP